MATRRDQLQSYQFLLQRIVSALVYRKTDPAQSPFRRAGGAVFAGLMLSIFALAITAVIGLFASGCGKTANWRDGNAIIKEEETGTFYVVLPRGDEAKGGQQKLYETANFASAALIAGTTEVFEIKAQSLRTDDDKVGMGPRVGIPGAPNALPKSDALSGGDWTLCSFPPGDNGDNPTSKLYIGTAKTTGKSLGKGALLVKSGKEQYLLSQSHKYEISNEAIQYLNATGETVHEIDKAVLDGIEIGDPLVAPDFGDSSKDSSATDTPVGTVYKNDRGNNTTYWVATEDNIAAITELQAFLITHGDENEFKDDNPSDFSSDPDNLKPAKDNTPLENVPNFAKAADESRLCALFPANGKEPKIVYNAKTPDLDGVSTPESSDEGAAYADQIVVAPGTGALVETGGSDDEGGLSLVTASGEIFGIEQTEPSKDSGSAAPANALTAFGYAGGDKQKAPPTVNMPVEVLKLIPQGPELSPDLAMKTVVGSR